MSTPPADFNEKIIEEFHTNDGRVGGMFEGMPILLLHHAGAKSGTARVNPLAYQADDGRYVIFASKAGAPSHPAWYHNLKANPDARLESGGRLALYTATEVEDEAERERLFGLADRIYSGYADYRVRADAVGRRIPIMRLTLEMN
jgi:deazaflavin-dependent oxidoreductase (nitroreductase family)